MAWMIVSDSSCEIRELKNPAPGVQFALVPFKIRVGEREYVDLATLNTQQMLQAMTDYNGASTSACPRRIMAGSLNFMVRKPLAKRPTVMPMQNRLAHIAAVVLSMPLPSAM